jgi:diguanylate cyclase (GGDEF)-like protein
VETQSLEMRASKTPSSKTPSSKTMQQLRHRAYIVVVCGALVTYTVDVVFGLLLGASRLELILWLVFISVLAFILWQMSKTNVLSRRNEVIGYTVISLDVLLEFLFNVATRNDTTQIFLSAGIWLIVMYVFAFFVFQPKQGLYISLALFMVSLLLSLPITVARGLLGVAEFYVICKYYCASFFVVVFGYAAASWRQSYEQVRLNAALAEKLAFTDGLTNVYNRRALEALLEKEATRAERYGRDFSIILFDLDDFKTINDSYGHSAGDEVLKKVADIVQAHLRKGDEVGRWGGEEFMVVCSETDSGQACLVAERLRTAIAETSFDNSVAVTASFGLARRQEGELIGSLYKRTDAALYAAKHAGKNCVKIAVTTGGQSTEGQSTDFSAGLT